MSPIAILHVALVVIGCAWVATLLVIFGHGMLMTRYERRAAPLLERGRAALAGLAVQPRLDRADMELLRSLPQRLKVRLFTELAPSIGGTQRRYISTLAADTGLVDAAVELCHSKRWWRRLRGVRLLTALGGGEEVVPPLFRDPNSCVRAEAAEWAGQNPTPGVVKRLILLLDYPEAVGSWVLRDSLLRIGTPVIEPLAEYLEAHGGPRVEPALEVATGLAGPRFAAAAERLCGDADPRVRARAAALAGAIGGDALVRRVEGMLDDPDASVRAAAAAALGHLGHWPAAPRLAAMLRDPAWVVRSQSALAMRRLGSPGQLLLRRALDDRDRFAADIARQVLDMPETTADRDQWR